MTDPSNTQRGNQSWVKDPELEGLFAAWDTDQPPLHLDPLPAVTARIAQRRRRRRAATAVVAAAVVLVGGVVTAHVVGTDRDTHPVLAPDNPGLTITYSSKAYTFTGFTDVACSTDPSGHQILRALFYPKDAFSGKNLLAPVLSFEARPDLVARDGPGFDLPEAAGDSDNNAFTLFTAVPLESGQDNEASSQEESATGTVTITHLSCGPDPTFTLTADAKLDSEVSGPRIPINGRISYPAPPQDSR